MIQKILYEQLKNGIVMRNKQMYLCKHGYLDIHDPSLLDGGQGLFSCKKNKVLWVFKRRDVCPFDCPYFDLKDRVDKQLKAMVKLSERLGLKEAKHD